MTTNNKQMWIIRGVPGSGKTTLAHHIFDALYGGGLPETRNARVLEANDYFMQGEEYRFDSSKVKEAFDDCLDRTNAAMQSGAQHVFVTNPFPKLAQMVPYEQLAAKHGYTVNIITCNTFHKNVHNVPMSTLRTMRSQFEHPQTNIL
jgi:predicted kinase